MWSASRFNVYVAHELTSQQLSPVYVWLHANLTYMWLASQSDMWLASQSDMWLASQSDMWLASLSDIFIRPMSQSYVYVMAVGNFFGLGVLKISFT